MKNKNNVDRPARTFARQVERIARSERVSIVGEVRKQSRRVFRALKHLDMSVDTLARELARRASRTARARRRGDVWTTRRQRDVGLLP